MSKRSRATRLLTHSYPSRRPWLDCVRLTWTSPESVLLCSVIFISLSSAFLLFYMIEATACIIELIYPTADRAQHLDL
ncbi:hypothetical protein BDW71DRAFT_186711, partial [Aspergillus fruticulosus]